MLKNNSLKMLIATTIGSMLEIFDFLVFIFLSNIIAKLFFPPHLHGLNIIFTYITISMSYLLRPIGGIILGNIGDKVGRKSAFTLSILLMSIPSFLLGLLPNYHHIGYVATILLIMLRVLQGFSLGGEVPGSITYIREQFNDKNYFLATAWLTFGANAGVVCAAKLVTFLSTTLTPYDMESFGYRIPFFLGGILSIIGLYIRKSVSESTVFKHLQETKKLSQAPIIDLIQNYRPQIFLGILVSLNVSIITSVFHVILPNLLVSYFNYKLNNALNLSLIGATTMAIFSLFFAYLTNFFKIQSLINFGIIALSLIFAVLILKTQLLFKYPQSIVALISLFVAAINGVFFGLLADLFPTKVRFSGIAICYNIAYILGAGLTPLWSDVVVKFTASLQPILWICLLVLVSTFILANMQRISHATKKTPSLR